MKQAKSANLLRFLATLGIMTVAATATLFAHDFWLVPNALRYAPNAPMEILGQSGSRFPTSGGPTQLAQVADARLVGRSSDEKVTDLSVAGKSLMLRHKPTAAGQYVVTVSLAARNARTTPERLQRYIALEGAPELAERYAKEGKYPKVDSVTQTSAKFAKTIVEVGERGSRAFDRTVGHLLELVPLDDPSAAKPGGTVRVRLLFRGRPVPNVHLRAGWGSPDAVSAEPPSGPPAKPDQVIVTGANGVASVSITEAGLWNVRTLYAEAMAGMPEHWEVYFSTMVFSVSGAASGDDADSGDEAVEAVVPTRAARQGGDSAAVVHTVARFHAALASGDSATALGLLAEDVVILETGGVETKAQYRSGHLNGDMAYAKAVPSTRTVTGVHVRGDAAWVTSTSITQGEYRDRQVNSQGAELAVLAREGGAWKIKAIHWSSRARRAP